MRYCVITGGEPMMFPRSVELSARLAAAGFHITFETAGTVLPDPAARRGGVTCDLMSISPKLSNSTPTGAWAERHEQRRLNIPVLQRLLDEFPAPARQLKFVVAADAERDLAEIDALLARLRGWSADDVLLMPEGVRTPAREHTGAVVRICLERGWRYCARLHIELFGNVRGT